MLLRDSYVEFIGRLRLPSPTINDVDGCQSVLLGTLRTYSDVTIGLSIFALNFHYDSVLKVLTLFQEMTVKR